jgi:Kelch motif
MDGTGVAGADSGASKKTLQTEEDHAPIRYEGQAFHRRPCRRRRRRRRARRVRRSLTVWARRLALGKRLFGPHISGRPSPGAPVDLRFGLTSVWTGTELNRLRRRFRGGLRPGRRGLARASRSAGDGQLLSPECCLDGQGDARLGLQPGRAFNPSTDTWRRLPPAPTRHGVLMWTGRELIGWGGGCCGDVSDDGSAYNPKTNTWRKLAPAPVPGQQSPAAVWTGNELVVLNGYDSEGKPVGGAAYDPAADTWRRISSLPPAHADGDGGLGRRRGPTRRRRLELRRRLRVQPGDQPLARARAGRAARHPGVRALDGTAPDRARPEDRRLRPESGPLVDPASGSAGSPPRRSGGVDGEERVPRRPVGRRCRADRSEGEGGALLHRSTRGMPPALPQCCGG